MRTMAAAKFKAQCLGLMDEVQSKRQAITITKNGKPVAKLAPLEISDCIDPLDAFHYPGLEIVGDIMAPLYTDEELQEFEDHLMDSVG